MADIILKTTFRTPYKISSILDKNIRENSSYGIEFNYSTQEKKQESLKKLEHSDYEFFEKNDTDFSKVVSYSKEERKQKTNLKSKTNNYTFSNLSNNLTEKESEKIKENFITSQKNGSFLWKTYVSFTDDYLIKNKIIENGKINEDLLKDSVKKGMSELLKRENISDYTFMGNIHYDTDNIHAHIYTVENGTPSRKMNLLAKNKKEVYNQAKFKIKNIEKAKSVINSNLTYELENLKLLHQISREHILKSDFNLNTLSNDELEQLIKIKNMLPQNQNLWQYNRKELRDVKPILTEFTKNYLEKYHTEDLEKFKKILLEQEKEYSKNYGESDKNKNYSKNKLEELESRTANRILKELKNFNIENINNDIFNSVSVADNTHKNKKNQIEKSKNEFRDLNSNNKFIDSSLKKTIKKINIPALENNNINQNKLKTNFKKIKIGISFFNRLNKLTKKDINNQIINSRENLKLQYKIKFKEIENEIIL